MTTTFYFLRIDGVNGNTFATKKAAVRWAKWAAKTAPARRVSLWYRDVIGQHIPVNYRRPC